MKWNCKQLASCDTDATCSVSALLQMTILTFTAFTTQSLYYHLYESCWGRLWLLSCQFIIDRYEGIIMVRLQVMLFVIISFSFLFQHSA